MFSEKLTNLFPILLFSILNSAMASPPLEDQRNTAEYQVLFDISANGKSGLVKNFGGYIQVYSSGGTFLFRFCHNFEGKGLDGQPNPKRVRTKLVPIGTVDKTAYYCRDYTPNEAAIGHSLIQLGGKSFFGMQTAKWSESAGGEILFRFARKIPLFGSPTYRIIRIRALRINSELTYFVETLLPKGEILPTHFLSFEVSDSAIGLPNGINALTLDPGERSERPIDIDELENFRTLGLHLGTGAR